MTESQAYDIAKALIIPKSEKQQAAEKAKIDNSITKEKTKFSALEGSNIDTFREKLDKMGYEFAPKEKNGKIVGGASWGTFGKNSAGKPELHFDYSEEKGVHNIRFDDETSDAAPRQLTGDCKIRVRKAK